MWKYTAFKYTSLKAPFAFLRSYLTRGGEKNRYNLSSKQIVVVIRNNVNLIKHGNEIYLYMVRGEMRKDNNKDLSKIYLTC